VVETQRGRDAIARELLGKLEKEAGAYSVISRKVMAAIDRNYTDNDKKLDRVAALVPVLTQIKEDTVFDRIKKMAEEQNQELRRVCVKYLAERGTKNDIPFLRNLKDRADNVSIYLRADIEDAIRKLEGS
jgi:HEAT repeat protein